MDQTQTNGRMLPMLDQSTEAFWAGARDGRLLVQRARPGGPLQWPPRPSMLPDWRDEAEWVEIDGAGEVYSFSIIHRSSHAFPPTPYVLAVVTLDVGVSMLSNIVDIAPEAVKIGLRVQVRFERVNDEISLPVFAPA
jgi:uncharacterized protein